MRIEQNNQYLNQYVGLGAKSRTLSEKNAKQIFSGDLAREFTRNANQRLNSTPFSHSTVYKNEDTQRYGFHNYGANSNTKSQLVEAKTVGRELSTEADDIEVTHSAPGVAQDAKKETTNDWLKKMEIQGSLAGLSDKELSLVENSIKEMLPLREEVYGRYDTKLEAMEAWMKGLGINGSFAGLSDEELSIIEDSLMEMLPFRAVHEAKQEAMNALLKKLEINGQVAGFSMQTVPNFRVEYLIVTEGDAKNLFILELENGELLFAEIDGDYYGNGETARKFAEFQYELFGPARKLSVDEMKELYAKFLNIDKLKDFLLEFSHSDNKSQPMSGVSRFLQRQ